MVSDWTWLSKKGTKSILCFKYIPVETLESVWKDRTETGSMLEDFCNSLGERCKGLKIKGD